MITKARIERVPGAGEFPEYKVWIPIFHGDIISAESSLYTTAMPIALPHGEKTTYTVGDVVYVAIEDYDINNVIILGMLPKTSGKDSLMNGADTTKTELSIDHVSGISFDKEGEMVLPYNTTMLKNPVDIKSDESLDDNIYLKADDFHNLYGTTGNLQEQITTTSEQFKIIFSTLLNTKVEMIQPENSNILHFNDSIWKSKSGYYATGIYTFTYDKDTKLFKFEYSPDGSTTQIKSRQLSIPEMNSNFGITNISPYIESGQTTIKIQVQQAVISIEAGGTGASTAEEARQNLGIYQTVIMSLADFDKISSGSYQPNTIYYLY